MVAFAILYTLSRRSVPTFSLITPTVIALYFVLTVIRVVMAYRIRLTFWLLVGSIIFDMGLLFGLLWSFHIQYEQPPSFYLKAPTLLYVFIFIALRALRFEVRYILLAGLAAAAGWLFMIAHVLWTDSDGQIITRDYVRYMTTNSILLGAEFDKIISILMVTGVLAVAVFRARKLLFRAVIDARATANLSRFFDPSIAERIGRDADALASASSEIRDVAILMLDIRNFTSIAVDLPPHRVMVILTEYRNLMLPAIESNGGSIDKFLGDGIMATFGAVTTLENSATRACAALTDALSAADKWSDELVSRGDPRLTVSGAVSKGSVVCGVVGDQARLEYTVIGDAVNLVAKLEKENKRLNTRGLVTVETYEAAIAQGMRPVPSHRRIAQLAIEGIDRRMDIVCLA
ncbi:MAG: adenylate/guanylate cyclase domain-containing protein [Rhodospirillales bacterium]|nr:adenylate/guanylate cyclase domain-containing protein [Rhodospirillales bacterium]